MDDEIKAARLACARWFAGMPGRKRAGAERGLSGYELRLFMEAGTPDDIFEQGDFEDLEKIWGDLDMAENVGARIKRIRRAYSLTQIELADILGVKQASVSRWEKNKVEPSEEALEILGCMVHLPASDIRYGRREPTSSGELIPEKPVVIVGELEDTGTISLFPKSQRYMTVSRPREGRPHDDVVGVVFENEAGFSVIQGMNWILFYRSENKQPPGRHHSEVCVIKRADADILQVALLVRAGAPVPTNTWVVRLPTGLMRTYDLEWVTPVLSLRQDSQRFGAFGG